jgi:hypothetical protein
VIVEPLQVPQVGNGRRGVSVQVGGAVSGELKPVGGGHRRDPQPLGDAAAPGHVGLQAVHGTRRTHPAEVVQIPAVFAGRDVGGHAVPDLAQAVEIVGGDRFLEPAHVQVGGRVHDPDGLLAAVPAVRVDEQLDVIADDGPGLPHAVQVARWVRAPGLADLDLDPGNALPGRPAAQLIAELALVVGGEAAAAVHGHAVAHRAE